MEMKRHEKPGTLAPINPAGRKEDEGKSSRSSSKSELKLIPDKSPSDDGLRKERRLSKASDSFKDTLERYILFFISI